MDEPMVESSGNVFADLGFAPDEAAVLQMRAALMSDLREYLSATGMTHDQAASALHLTRSRVGDLVAGRWEKFSLESLVSLEGQALKARNPPVRLTCISLR